MATADIAALVARRVRDLRADQRITLEVLAERAGMPLGTLSRIERKRMVPSIRSLARIAAGLGVPISTLLTEDPVPMVSSDGIPPEIRGIALRLLGQPPQVLDRVRRVVDALVAEET